ncbi:sugar ABC transporter substrate-binding protein [Bacillus sp. FJAT-29790]|uniref:sugar ABC transporter substrate-binding protein n=1 Tax=Bacillus sp. FJAT-29790 TaxID=1895002 RepID=UPI001C2228FB|nr:sugar ABC transporter substrate-binding protein [Bacillus sp. FJAT-29790]MBU8877513.1 sugar ABC transporter substrate-binding protein [Bacillus sp. FJAT-29790]
MIKQLIVLFSLIIVLGACSSSNQATNNGSNEMNDSKDNVRKRIAFFSSGSNTTYEQVAFEQAKETAKELEMDLDIFDASYDALKQLGQIQNAITSNKYNGFVVQANDGNQLCKIVTEDAAKKGIAISTINIELCGEHNNAAKNTITFVGGQGIGVYQGILKKIFSDNPEGGKIAAIGGPATGANYLNMQAAFELELPNYPNWELVGMHATDYTANNANQVAQNVLQAHKDLNVIFSNYSGMTVGVVSAKESLKRDDVKIYDFGGDKWAFEAVKNGKIELTATMLPRREIELGILALHDYFNGKEVPKFFDLSKEDTLPGTPYVEKSNIEEFESRSFPQY